MSSIQLYNRATDSIVEETVLGDRFVRLAYASSTDVLREGSELVYVGDREIIRQAFGLTDAGDGHIFL